MGPSKRFQAALQKLRSIPNLDAAILIPLAAIVALVPRYLRGTSCGHDFDFHLVSWMEARRSWSQGDFYPHWAQSPNWGAGEPRFVFYPPLTWMLGAALSFLVDWDSVPALLTFLALAAAGFATRALAREFLPGSQATLAGIVATLTPYALFTAYERTAYGELAAAPLIPLILLFSLRKKRSVIPLALTLALTWLTNAPAGVMAAYLIAFAALAAALIERQWWPIRRALLATPLGLGLASFYLIPAAWEQRWIDIHQALDIGMRIQDSWLFARHSSPDLELHDRVLLYASSILILTFGMAACGFLIALRRRKLPTQSRAIWLPLALLLPVILLLQFPIAAPAWTHLPKLAFLQFPWRLLAVMAAPYAIFCAAATPLASRRARSISISAWTIALCFGAGVATLAFWQYCDSEDAVSNQLSIFQDGSGVDGTDEYAPSGADNTLVASGLPDGCLVSDPSQEVGEGEPDAAPVWFAEQGSCDETYTAKLWQSEHKLLQIDTDHAGFVILRERRYPAWQITINGHDLTRQGAPPTDANAKDGQPPAGTGPDGLRPDGLIVLPVPTGPSTIELRWSESNTPDTLWGRSVSLLSLAALLAVYFVERRPKQVRLS